MNPNKLFVGNLSYRTMENDLQDHFAQAGVVTSVSLMMDKVTGNLEGSPSLNSRPRKRPQRRSSNFTTRNSRGGP